jgi:ParB-like chromosome segregation protein Spo0J
MSIRVREEYAKLIPPLSPEDYRALRESISELGLLTPLVINPQGVLLDGHHRLKALQELGKKLGARDFVVRSFGSELEERRFVLVSNLHRRHLTPFQRAELALPLLQIERELARQRQLKGTLPPNGGKVGEAAEIVGKRVGLSARTFERAITVITKAPEELKDKVRAGEVSINQAYEQIRTLDELAGSDPVEVVGKERADQLAPLQEGIRQEAVRAIIQHRLNPAETKQLVAALRSGEPPDRAVNKLLSGRMDVRTRRWQEQREGRTQVRCLFPGCRAILVLRHDERGGHSIETIDSSTDADVLGGEEHE